MTVSETAEDRDAGGRFARGNTAAKTHGAFSAAVLAAAAAEIAAKVDALTSEQGDLSAIKRDLIRRYVETELLATHALRVVEQLGLNGRGTRALAAYHRLVDRQVRLGRMLGLGRAAKPKTIAAQFAALHAGDPA
jgi:hypothetical protein